MEDLKLSRNIYETILFVNAGVTSSRDLTWGGYEKVLDRFKELGFKPRKAKVKRERKPTLPPNMTELPTREQLGMISGLEGDIKWRVSFKDFLKSRFGWDRPRTKQDAQKVIEALKSMTRRQAACPRT
jgi:hypothetical protein